MAPESAGAARGLESILGRLQAFAQFRYSSLGLDFGNNAEWCWDDHHGTTSCRIPPMYPVRNKSGTPAAEYGSVELRALLEVLDSKQKEWQDVQTVMLFVDNRSGPGQPTYWQDFSPWVRERCRWRGPYGEVTAASFMLANIKNGLGKIHYTWAGTFVLEAASFLYPHINFILSDADCIPLSLLGVQELVRLAASIFPGRVI